MESNNLLESRPEMADSLRLQLTEFLDRHDEEYQEPELSDPLRKALKTLRYLDS